MEEKLMKMPHIASALQANDAVQLFEFKIFSNYRLP
jgi:hypothetical protein